jgi:hypothetical protein
MKKSPPLWTPCPFIQKFSTGQDEYFEMLSSLIEDYDRKNVTWPKIKTS